MDSVTEMSYLHTIRQLRNENDLLKEEVRSLRKFLISIKRAV